MGWELDEVERPFVAQFVATGWRYIEGDLETPARTCRASFAEVIREATLRRRLHALNLDASERPWLDDQRLSQAVELCRQTAPQARDLLRRLKVAGRLVQHGERRGAHYSLAKPDQG